VPYVLRNKSFGRLWEPEKDCLYLGATHSALENISTVGGKKSLSPEDNIPEKSKRKKDEGLLATHLKKTS
jgi:hypothetical protein